jgi:CheY-like chemotaxis protein
MNDFRKELFNLDREYTILLAEDSVRYRIELELLLRKHLYVNLHHFSNGRDLVDYYQWMKKNQMNVDLIVIDIFMLVMKGPEASQEILQTNPEAPIVAFTGSLEGGLQFLRNGVHHFFRKPIEEKQILETLRAFKIYPNHFI